MKEYEDLKNALWRTYVRHVTPEITLALDELFRPLVGVVNAPFAWAITDLGLDTPIPKQRDVWFALTRLSDNPPYMDDRGEISKRSVVLRHTGTVEDTILVRFCPRRVPGDVSTDKDSVYVQYATREMLEQMRFTNTPVEKPMYLVRDIFLYLTNEQIPVVAQQQCA